MCPLIRNPLTLETSMVPDLSEDGRQVPPKASVQGETGQQVATTSADKKMEALKKKFLMTVRCLAIGMIVLIAGYLYWYFIGSWRVRETALDENPFSQNNIEKDAYLALYSYDLTLPRTQTVRKQTFLQRLFCGKPTSHERSAFCN